MAMDTRANPGAPRDTDRWSVIRRYPRIDKGACEADFLGWTFYAEPALEPGERATAYDAWAEYFDWCAETAAQVARGDQPRQRLIEEWADSMAGCCRRLACRALGIDPGPALPRSTYIPPTG
ncbi:hypothetical protein GCM10023148_26110 [Actinokineospora soli]